MKTNIKSEMKRILFVFLAAVIAAINTKLFVTAGGLYPGGVGGVTLLIQRILGQFFDITVPYSAINLLLNTVPIYIGFKYIGKKFTCYSCFMVVLSSILVDMIPTMQLTDDMLLICVFGGIIGGLASSLCLWVNTSGGGTDLISIYLSEKKGIDAFNIMLGFNVIIIGIGGALFGWEKALYSIIFQYVATQALHILYRNYQQSTLFVVTNHAKEISETIFSITNHGATVIDGEGSFDYQKRQIVYSVVSSAESKKLIKKIKETDPDAFVNEIKTEQISGKFYLQPRD